MCLRFLFLLITRLAAGLRLSRREEAWTNAEILMLRHQLTVLQRHQPPWLELHERVRRGSRRCRDPDRTVQRPDAPHERDHRTLDRGMPT